MDIALRRASDWFAQRLRTARAAGLAATLMLAAGMPALPPALAAPTGQAALPAAAPVAVVQPAPQEPRIEVTPLSARWSETIVVRGFGFTPGEEIEDVYVSPDDEEFGFLDDEGEPLLIVVDEDGAFFVEVIPELDFEGAPPGEWLFTYCRLDGSDVCWRVVVEIRAPDAT